MISLNTTFKIGQVKLDIFQSKNVFIFAINVKLLFDIHTSFELELNIGLLLDETAFSVQNLTGYEMVRDILVTTPTVVEQEYLRLPSIGYIRYFKY